MSIIYEGRSASPYKPLYRPNGSLIRLKECLRCGEVIGSDPAELVRHDDVHRQADEVMARIDGSYYKKKKSTGDSAFIRAMHDEMKKLIEDMSRNVWSVGP